MLHRRSGLAFAALLTFALLSSACSPAAPSGPPRPSQESPSDSSRGGSAAAPAAPTAAPRGAAPPASKPAAAPAAKPASTAAGNPAPALAQGAASADQQQGSPELPIVQSLGRMIIYTTELTILTGELDALPSRIGTLALAHGGYVAGVETKDDGGLPTTVVIVKVPPERYEETMRGLRGLAAEVRSESARTQDVTEEFSDTQTQIASLEATHAQLLELMRQSGTVEEILKVQQQAAEVKLRIDRLKGRATALERLSEFATITVRAQSAMVAMQREYTTVRSELRRAETTRANLELQLKRTHTPEEEATLRDKLGETLLAISRLQTRLADIEAKAAAAQVALPTADVTGSAVLPGDSLAEDYVNKRVALRRAEIEQRELTEALRAGKPDADPNRLTLIVLEITRLQGELRAIQERAGQLGVVLPTLTPELEAALVGTSVSAVAPDPFAPVREAFEASLSFLGSVVTTVAVGAAFTWWALPLVLLLVYLARRRPNGSRPAYVSTVSGGGSATGE